LVCVPLISLLLTKKKKTMFAERVLSGMRPTGNLHLGHYHGVLKNWVRLQSEYPCFFFVADWHALTTHYETPDVIEQSVWDMVIDWLAAGVDPNQATLFIQSRVPEHAELFLLLSMGTPLGWLERVPTYKDQIEKLKEKDLQTYGFLGYPLLQAADILIYRAQFVPVGEDQVPHVEMTREVARRFNYLYGREPGFEEKALEAVKKLGSKRAKMYLELRVAFQERGDDDALEQAKALLQEAQSLSMADRERLFGFLEGARKIILPEPQALLTTASRMPGIDGQKMSKSYGNTISIREQPEEVVKKIRTMPTDPARVRRTDVGDPARCPVWQLHTVYSSEDTKQWVDKGCKSAGIGCLECKQPVIDAILAEQQPMFERAQKYLDDPSLLRSIIADGCDKARKVAQETMREVREAMGLAYD
jgi:tryptophanyl-tRNA synthetase